MFKKKEVINFDQVDTIVGGDCEFQGTLLAKGTLRVDGKVTGEIKVQGDLIVGEAGQVDANVTARHVTIAGAVTGDMEVEGILEVAPSGKLVGDITVGNLVINEGATFQGNCTMQGNPRKGGKKESVPQQSKNN